VGPPWRCSGLPISASSRVVNSAAASFTRCLTSRRLASWGWHCSVTSSMRSGRPDLWVEDRLRHLATDQATLARGTVPVMQQQQRTADILGPDDVPDRQDDGLFGPASVSWKVFLDPSAQLGMVCAVLMQALHPNMMRLFDHVSDNAADPAGRALRTGRYVLTTIFGDQAHAEAAGASVRRLHSLVRWTDPKTGEVLAADTPEWLEWTHSCIVWGVLQAAATYGPRLSADEQDRFVVEQHRAAALVGLDPRANSKSLM